MELSVIVENCKIKNIQLPEELSNIGKWDILQLLIPGLTKAKAKTQLKNYSRLDSNSMLFMCIDTLVRMFLTMCFLDGRKDTDEGQVKTRTFKYLIANKLEEIDELEKELNKIKAGKGVIDKKEHDSEIKELNKEIERLTKENAGHSDRLKQQEIYFKDKQANHDKIIRKQILFELKCQQSMDEQK